MTSQEWHTHETLPSISFNLKEAIWSLTKKKASKQRKKEKLIITLDCQWK